MTENGVVAVNYVAHFGDDDRALAMELVANTLRSVWANVVCGEKAPSPHLSFSLC